jgi:sugar lactone lactonase YvrE
MKNIPCTLRTIALALAATLIASLVGASTLRAAGGDLYLTDTNNGTIEQATATQGGSSAGDFATSLKSPYGLAFDSAGYLYVDEGNPGVITKIAPDGTKTTFANEPGRLNGMAFAPNGNLFVADYNLGTIDYFSPTGARTYHALGLNQPAGLVFDSAGNLYVAERGANVVSKYNGGIKSVFTSGLIAPTGLAADRLGHLYVVEENGSLYRLNSDGSKSAPLATGLGGATAIAIDSDDNIYVAENAKPGFKQAVTEKITSSGARSIFTGNSADHNLQGLAIAPTGHLRNISTRVGVQSGDNVLIAGFITTGEINLLLRGIGPSLSKVGITGALQDPFLSLYGSDVGKMAEDDNWKDGGYGPGIQSTGIAPTDDRESALLRGLGDNSYTVIETGKNNTTGIGLVEVYEIAPTPGAELANISTRGFVGTGDNVLIGGFIIGGGEATVVVRAIGPSLTAFGVAGALQDPTLTVRNSNGFPVGFDNDWKQHQQAAIQATGLAPNDDRESAVLLALPAGGYTAVVSGVGDTTGVGLVEIYRIK